MSHRAASKFVCCASLYKVAASVFAGSKFIWTAQLKGVKDHAAQANGGPYKEKSPIASPEPSSFFIFSLRFYTITQGGVKKVKKGEIIVKK